MKIIAKHFALQNYVFIYFFEYNFKLWKGFQKNTANYPLLVDRGEGSSKVDKRQGGRVSAGG